MATLSSILAWKIPWTEESGRLQSLGFQSIRHDGVTEHAHTHVFFLSFFFFLHACFLMDFPGGSLQERGN